MKSHAIKQVEAATLATFTEEIPSIYFSDKTEAEFHAYKRNAEITCRDLLKFPPKMFQGADLIDFGAGTGENPVDAVKNIAVVCDILVSTDDPEIAAVARTAGTLVL